MSSEETEIKTESKGKSPFIILLMIKAIENIPDEVPAIAGEDAKKPYRENIVKYIEIFTEKEERSEINPALEAYKGGNISEIQQILRKKCTGEIIMTYINDFLLKIQKKLDESS